MLTEPQTRADGLLGHAAPVDFMVRCKQLEALVGTLEDSFSSSEQVLSSSPASPGFTATLRAERDRRQQLLRQLTKLVSSVNICTASDDAQNASGSVAVGSCMDAEYMMGNSIAGASHDPKGGSVEWKYTTLLRLRKFLRRQYRARKNKVVDCVSNTGSCGQDIADERAQLQQLAADIKSIEFEIRLLSDSQTAVKQHADVCVEYDEAGSAEPKDRSLQSDSARSRRDTVNRLLKSAGSLGGSSASRMGGMSSGERLARLHEGDEGDTAGEEKAEGDLRGVRRNLLELYADPQQDAPATAAGSAVCSASMESQADATAPRSTGLPAAENRSNLQSVDMCIEAIRSMGAKARAAEGSLTLQQADDTASMSEVVVEERGSAGPCKIARLARQLDMDDCVERENDSSPSKIERLLRQMATTTQSATPQEPEPTAGSEPVAPVRLFASSVEHENNSSPSKIDRQRRQNASKAADAQAQQPETAFMGSEQAVPVRVLGSISEHTIPDSAPVPDAWRDVDLARWAAVNRGASCPSPVPVVAPGAVQNRAVYPQASICTSKPLTASEAVTMRRLDAHAEGGEEVVKALAVQKFSVLEDKDALRERAAAGGGAAGSAPPAAIGTSDSEDSCLVTGNSRVEETVSSGTSRFSGDISTAGEEALLRTIKKILNGPGSTPTGKRRQCAAPVPVEPTWKSQLDKGIAELSLECLAALRSSAFLEDPDKVEETDKLLGDTNGGMDGGEDVCGQARLEGREDSVDLDDADVSDLLLKSVDVSGSFAAAERDDLENRSLLEGTSLLEDFEALPVDRTAESVPLFPYVYAATPLGEPSAQVQKALVRDFDRVCLEGMTTKMMAGVTTVLGSTPMGEPSGPVAKSLVEMFDQCLSPAVVKDSEPASSPGQAARAEDHGISQLRSVVKCLEFPSGPELPNAKMTMASEATLCVYGCASSGCALENVAKPAQKSADWQHGASRPVTAAMTRPKHAVSSRPMSAVASRISGTLDATENAIASRGKASAYTPALALKAASAGGMDGAGGSIAIGSANRAGPTLAWSAPGCDPEPAALFTDSPALGDACTNPALGGGSVFGVKGGGLFSAARAQAREAQREGHTVSAQREAQPSVRLAPPIRSPADTCSSSPLTLIGSSTGAAGRQRSSSRPPSGTMTRGGNNNVTRAASVSPDRQMFGNIGLVAAREALSTLQPRAAAAAASGWLPQQKRLSPTSSPYLQSNVPAMIHNNMMTGPVQSVSVATAASTNGRTPQVMLNNKMDLMSSVRLARRNQTLASGPTSLASGPTPSVEQRLALKLTATSTGPRRAPPQHEPAALPKPGISGSVSHDLKPINCLPKTRPISEDELSEAGICGLAVNSAQVGPVGGKRMSAPRVTGTGVASKQPPRPPPRAAGVCLEDVDVTEPTHSNSRSPPEREALPSLPATDRTSAAAAGGLSSELMLLLREAAAERLASYRVQ